MKEIKVNESAIEKLALQFALEYTLIDDLMLCPNCEKKLMRYGLSADKFFLQ